MIINLIMRMIELRACLTKYFILELSKAPSFLKVNSPTKEIKLISRPTQDLSILDALKVYKKLNRYNGRDIRVKGFKLVIFSQSLKFLKFFSKKLKAVQFR